MKVSFECDLEWDDLEGNSNTRRRCHTCDHAVYNLSGMTHGQAQRVIKRHEGKKLCVHFVTRAGRIVHDGDPLQQLSAQRRGVRRLVAGALLVQAGFLAFADDPAESYFDPFRHIADVLTPEPVQEKFTMGANSEVASQVVF